jgi:homoserine dehydrogenase
MLATNDSELSDDALAALVAHKAKGGKLAMLRNAAVRSQDQPADAFLRSLVEKYTAAPRTIVVDCSASDATVPALLLAARELHVVSANKRPFADTPMATFSSLARTTSSPARVRYESTVGAGLPVIAALSRLISAHDEVRAISGCLSGSLGYITTGLQAGEPFSAVVRRAKGLGYTEPDPRDDLSGTDVARKAVILARTLGMAVELGDVQIEPLCPPNLAALPREDFMAKLPLLDAGFASRAAAAAADGKVLRYVAKVQPPTRSGGARGRLTVGLVGVPLSSPLGGLSGTDNLVEVSTEVYATTPLVLRGAGAGAGATASGVLSDMVELAFTGAGTPVAA